MAPNSGFRPKRDLQYEPMFASMRELKERLLDAADLAIDFATLGEYGLEPAREIPVCRTVPCRQKVQLRSASPRSIPASIS